MKNAAALPRRWLFTDERLGGTDPQDPLWAALARLPRGSGVVVRDYALPPEARRRLFAEVQAVARRQRLMLVASALPGAGRQVHQPGFAQGPRRGASLLTASAHSATELHAAFARGADLVFVSPLFATASHPGLATLGPVRFGLLAKAARGPVVALGGMNAARLRRLKPLGAYGFAAIDAWV